MEQTLAGFLTNQLPDHVVALGETLDHDNCDFLKEEEESFLLFIKPPLPRSLIILISRYYEGQGHGVRIRPNAVAAGPKENGGFRACLNVEVRPDNNFMGISVKRS